MDGVTWDGRAVYQQSGGSNYLYFWAAFSDWRVGSDYTASAAGLLARGLLRQRSAPPIGALRQRAAGWPDAAGERPAARCRCASGGIYGSC